jgi:hypothetical protein
LSTLVREREREQDRYQATLHGFNVPDEELTEIGQNPEHGQAPEAIPEPPPTPTRAWLRGQELAKQRNQRAVDAARQRAEDRQR